MPRYFRFPGFFPRLFDVQLCFFGNNRPIYLFRCYFRWDHLRQIVVVRLRPRFHIRRLVQLGCPTSSSPPMVCTPPSSSSSPSPMCRITSRVIQPWPLATWTIDIDLSSGNRFLPFLQLFFNTDSSWPPSFPLRNPRLYNFGRVQCDISTLYWDYFPIESLDGLEMILRGRHTPFKTGIGVPIRFLFFKIPSRWVY